MENIKSVVQQLIQNMSGTNPSAVMIEDHISRLLTPEEKKHIRMIGIKGKTIAFEVDTSAWMYHFENQKKQILKKLKSVQPDILNIYFKLGKIYE
jgi:hypothetical protein